MHITQTIYKRVGIDNHFQLRLPNCQILWLCTSLTLSVPFISAGMSYRQLRITKQ